MHGNDHHASGPCISNTVGVDVENMAQSYCWQLVLRQGSTAQLKIEMIVKQLLQFKKTYYIILQWINPINSNRFILLINQIMEKHQPLAERMLKSEEEFRKQFDPTSGSYHGGLQVIVPTGGDRVPESMPTMYPQGYNPNQQEQVVDYGEEYKQVESNRNIFQNLKKQLAKLGPVVQAFYRHEDHFKNKGDPNNQKHKKTYEESIAKEKQTLKPIQDLLQTFIPTLEKMDWEGKQCAKELIQIIHESGKKHETKQALGDFNFQVKKLSTKTFSIAQKCLQKLKDIKKQHATKQKAAQNKQQAS